MGLLSGLLNRTARTPRGGARGGSPLGTGPGGTGGTTGRSGVGRSGVGSMLSRLTRGRRSL